MRPSTHWLGTIALMATAASCSSPDPAPVYGMSTTTGSNGATSSVAGMSGMTANSVSATGASVTTGVGPTATMSGNATTTTSSNSSAGSGATGVTGANASAGGAANDGSPAGNSTSAATTLGGDGGGLATSSQGGTSTSVTETASSNSTTGGMAGCASGPLAAPLPNCSPEPVPDTGDYYEDCVARINQFRWECQCLPPLERWTEAEDCADQQAEYDYEQDNPHAGFRDNICSPGGGAQNECPGYGPNFGIVDFCLQQMWDEGPGDDFNAHGHYLNMSNPDFSRVACGMYVTPEGDIWAVQNFSN